MFVWLGLCLILWSIISFIYSHSDSILFKLLFLYNTIKRNQFQQITDLNQLLKLSINALESAPNSRSFLRAPVFTVGNSSRTVILRKANFRLQFPILLSYSHFKAAKVQLVKEDGTSEYLFHDPFSLLQFRLRGKSIINNQNEITKQAWSPGHNNLIMKEAPGTQIDNYNDISIEEDENEIYKNFTVIQTTITELECLILKQGGHKRALFRFDPEYGTRQMWLVP